MHKKLTVLVVAVAALVGWGSTAAGAHTGTDVVAVPAGEAATVKLKPTHGCAGSPTVEVAIQAPVEGATAGTVAGWTATATADGKGHTVIEWKGGSLPADQTGEFPVTFTAPAKPGTLLTFPAIQYCESGEKLSWISGDPAAEFPAPRLLILPAGSEPAGDLEEVPADAPGRSQLVEVVDVDNPEATTTTVAAEAPATTTTTRSATSTTVAGSASSPDTAGDTEDSAGNNTPVLVGVAVVVVLAAGAAGLVLRRRRRAST